MNRLIIGILLTSTLVGCSGRYILAIPDAVAASGSDAPVTVQLRRQEFWMLRPPVRGAVLRMWVIPGQQRAAYTRRDGWAFAAVPAPAEVGTYTLTICHQDPRGDAFAREGSCYVMDRRRLVVAVDWEAIEDAHSADSAAGPLARLAAAGVQIAYVVTDAGRSPEAHDWLKTHGLPDGPVLSWGWRRNWRGKAIAVTGSLPTIREQLPGLTVAAGPEDDFLRAAEELNMVAVSVGVARGKRFVEFADWSALADRLLAAGALLGERDFSTISSESIRQGLGASPPTR